MRDDLRHTVVLSAGTGVSSLFRIAYVVFVGRIVGPAEYADFYSAMTVVMLFATALAPISGTASRFASLYLARRDSAALGALTRFAQREVARLALPTGFIGAVIGFALMGRLSWDSPWVPLFVALTLPANLLLDLPRGLLRGTLRFGEYSWNLILEAVLRLGICVAVIFRFPTASAALLAYFLAAVLTLPLARAQTRTAIAEGGEFEEGTTVRRFARNLFAVALIGALLQNVDVLVVKALFSDHESGIYSAASSLAKSMGLLFLPFASFLLPTLTQRFSRGERLTGPLVQAMATFALFAAVGVAGFAWIGDLLVTLLYGEAYASAGALLVPLALAMFFALLSLAVEQAFVATDRFRFVPLYAGSILLVAVALWWGRGSLEQVAQLLLLSQAVVFAILFGRFVVADRRAGRTS